MRLGVDVGGTFTDAVLLGPERSWTAKAPTTPGDQSEGVLAAIELVLAQAGCEPGAVDAFSHGMTIGTNALLERRGAATALLATEGFTDLLETARQNRAHLYRLCADRPPPLAPRRSSSAFVPIVIPWLKAVTPLGSQPARSSTSSIAASTPSD